MKEFDFEELDRAVNSLISPTATPADSPTPANSSVDKNTTPVVDSNSVIAAPAESSSDSPTPTPVTSVPPRSIVERRQSGRFMDVVHPSSDMKTATNSTSASSRDEIKVAPRGVEPVSSSAQPAAASAWPDPIDFTSPKESISPAEPASAIDPTKPEVEPNLTPELSVDESLNAASGPNSPFLPDAKVEKRPLGAFSDEHPDETPQPPETPVEKKEPSSDTTKPDDKKPVDNQTLGPVGHDEVDTPLPAELQDNLLSIESDTTNPVATDTPTHEQEQPVGPTSITQQYTATPSTNTDKPGEIYDTKAYHQALKSPAKKKSSWWLVVWIVLLLVVGAGAGAAIYYFVLPAL